MSSKLTQEEFISRVVDVWGDRWDLSKAEYTIAKNRVTLICKEHGSFQMLPARLFRGVVGCTQCNGRVTDTETFLAKAKEVWGDRWDYAKTEYTGAHDKVVLTCKEHGDFQQLPSTCLRGSVGCSPCYSRAISSSTQEFITRAREKWGDRWDYSQVDYRGANSTVVIVCKEHGAFMHRAISHLIGYVGCKKCRSLAKQGPRYTNSQFLSKAREVWGDRWDYSQTEYEGMANRITVSCREHGPFEQLPGEHLHGSLGCLMCRGVDSASLLEKASAVWGDRWDYSKTLFGQGSGAKKVFICKEHGEFIQIWGDHLRGQVGCSKCSNNGTSKAETELFAYVSALAPSAQQRAIGVLPNRRELDIYVPELSLAIEYNGLYWHNEKQKGKNYHAEKTRLCKEQGLRLVHVWEDDWVNKTDIVKRTLSVLLHKSDLPKVAARKVEICPISYAEASAFLDQYHIQGATTASIYLGLIHLGEIVGVTTLQYRKDGSLELSRYATSKNVQGGHSKVVAYIEKRYEYTHLVTFADLSYSAGNLYATTGWVEDGTLAPDYSYVVMKRREHKFSYRKARFKKDPDLLYQEGLTERELAEMNGLHRIYDAGKIRYIKPHP